MTDERFFGSGVILATAVVHLLDPAIKQIGDINTYAYGGCISNAWGDYPYPVGFSFTPDSAFTGDCIRADQPLTQSLASAPPQSSSRSSSTSLLYDWAVNT
jgi:hypothetical protein